MSGQKEILILGSTGSIGINTLKVIRKFSDSFKVTGLTANTNIDELEKQINEFHPEYAVVTNAYKAVELRKRIKNKCEILSGNEGLIEISQKSDYDILVTALVGFAGLAPTIEGIKRKKRIALANKETLVVAGELITEMLFKYGAELIPIDSEHSAIFQCLIGEEKDYIEKLILTASGGPFLNLNKQELTNVTIDQALAHPNWKMGSKITIDSATMMNKGLEVIEAHWLFGLPKEKIEVVVHPQSIIHSMVEFIDGSIKAQLSMPDMKLPIQYALTFPERFRSDFVETKLAKINELTFFEPDFNKFECLRIAYNVMQTGGTSTCVLNAANEVAVDKFLKGKINFTEIPDIINSSLDKIENHRSPDLETIFDCDRQTREFAENLLLDN